MERSGGSAIFNSDFPIILCVVLSSGWRNCSLTNAPILIWNWALNGLLPRVESFVFKHNQSANINFVWIKRLKTTLAGWRLDVLYIVLLSNWAEQKFNKSMIQVDSRTTESRYFFLTINSVLGFAFYNLRKHNFPQINVLNINEYWNYQKVLLSTLTYHGIYTIHFRINVIFPQALHLIVIKFIFYESQIFSKIRSSISCKYYYQHTAN
jgi:hypothetical protein